MSLRFNGIHGVIIKEKFELASYFFTGGGGGGGRGGGERSMSKLDGPFKNLIANSNFVSNSLETIKG